MQKQSFPHVFLVAIAACCVFRAVAESAPPTGPSLSDLTIWDDGLSEMSYFHASDTIYGVDRAYTRVLLVNRQWMSAESGIKVEPDAPQALPVFKINLSEQIPTENYNYRYLVSVFLERPLLVPFKLAASSQEWCGMTYKHMRWYDDKVTLQSFSYYDKQGDRSWTLAGSAMPYEALLLVARDVVARGEARDLMVLAPARTSRAADPTVRTARMIPGRTESISVPGGKFDTVRVRLEWDGVPTEFHVASTPPFLLVRYQTGDARGDLALIERRAYWDRASRSRFYAAGQAP